MVSVMKAGSDWRHIGLLLLLLVFSLTRGEIFDTQQMERINEHQTESVESCVRPLEEGATLKVGLMLKSTAVNTLYDAGVALIENDLISPVGSWHTLKINHKIEKYKHILAVKVNDVDVEYEPENTGKWFSTSYSFDKILLFAKGKVEVVDCDSLASTADGEEESWVWSLGGVGGMPVVPLTIVLVVVLAVTVTLVAVWWRKRNRSKMATKAVTLDSFRQHAGYQPVDVRDEKGRGDTEEPRDGESAVGDAHFDQRMNDQYEPQVNSNRHLSTFSNGGAANDRL